MFVFWATLFLAVPVVVGDAATAGAAAAQTTAESPAAPSVADAPGGEPPFFSWAYWQEEGGTSTSRSEVARNFLLALAAFIGLGFGIWRAYTAYRQTQASQRQAVAANEQARAANEQARIAEQGHITDRFSTAVEHLGSEQLPVRLGGIYALWRLAKDSPERDVISVIDILCAFVRHPPHETGQGPDPGASEDGQAAAEKAGSATEIRPDVQTVLNLIGPENADYRALLPAGYRLDLTGANLANADLTGADLAGADLGGANLTGVFLSDANLTDAFLFDADLTDAVLSDANLGGAELSAANLTGAKNLTQEQLQGIRYNPDHPPKLPPGLVLPGAPPEPKPENAAP